MSKSRVSSDVLAAGGFGFLTIIPLRIVGAFVASTTSVAGQLFGTNLAAARSGPKAGSVITLSHVSVFAKGVGDRTTGTYVINLIKTDVTGTQNLGTIATITLPASAAPTLVDLRDSQKRGYKLKLGECIRVDTGAAPTGGTTNASEISLHIVAEIYGIAC